MKRVNIVFKYYDVITWKPFPRYWPFAGNSPVTGEFPSRRASNAAFDVYLMLVQITCKTSIRMTGDLRLNDVHCLLHYHIYTPSYIFSKIHGVFLQQGALGWKYYHAIILFLSSHRKCPRIPDLKMRQWLHLKLGQQHDIYEMNVKAACHNNPDDNNILKEIAGIVVWK